MHGELLKYVLSNHQETDKRLIFHTTMNNEAVILVAKGRSLLLLLIYDLGQLECVLPP